MFTIMSVIATYKLWYKCFIALSKVNITYLHCKSQLQNISNAISYFIIVNTFKINNNPPLVTFICDVATSKLKMQWSSVF